MIEQNARVIEVEGAFAVIETERVSSCGSCASSKSCGTSALSKVLGHQVNHIRVINQINAKAGDQVIVGLQESALLRGSMAVYLVPLLGLILGGMLAQLAGEGGDIASGLGAACGFLLGFVWLRRFSDKVAKDDRYQAVIIRNLGSQHGDECPVKFYPEKF